jgi:cell division protein ZapA
VLKSKLRKKILKIREKNNKKNIQISFNQIIKILKKEIEKNKEDYEKIIEAAADEIENFVEKANLENPVQ